MSYDSDFEADNDIDSFHPEEELFYRGFVSPADEWNVKPDSLFSELNGSIFEAKDAVTRRLKRLNEVIAFAESKDNKKYNKKTRISNQYNFLQQFIPEQMFTKITEILSYLSKDKKKIAKDIGLNLDTLANILSLWQLELYSTGNYVSESTFDEINRFLKESSTFGNLKNRGHITSKDVDRAESRILRQIYSQMYSSEDLEKRSVFPKRVLSYYQEYMISLDLYLNENQRKLQLKQQNLPFHVYVLTQKTAILKKILPKIALDYFKMYIEPNDLEVLKAVIDDFYYNKNAIVGELKTQGIIILEKYYGNDAIINEHLPTKFFTRVRKYRLEFGPVFSEIIKNLRQITIEPIFEEETTVITENLIITDSAIELTSGQTIQSVSIKENFTSPIQKTSNNLPWTLISLLVILNENEKRKELFRFIMNSIKNTYFEKFNKNFSINDLIRIAITSVLVWQVVYSTNISKIKNLFNFSDSNKISNFFILQYKKANIKLPQSSLIILTKSNDMDYLSKNYIKG